MARIKIFLDGGETLDGAESDLLKAMVHHASGAVHDSETFADPAMKAVASKLEDLHVEMYKKMISEILEAIENEYRLDLGNK